MCSFWRLGMSLQSQPCISTGLKLLKRGTQQIRAHRAVTVTAGWWWTCTIMWRTLEQITESLQTLDALSFLWMFRGKSFPNGSKKYQFKGWLWFITTCLLIYQVLTFIIGSDDPAIICFTAENSKNLTNQSSSLSFLNNLNTGIF